MAANKPPCDRAGTAMVALLPTSARTHVARRDARPAACDGSPARSRPPARRRPRGARASRLTTAAPHHSVGRDHRCACGSSAARRRGWCPRSGSCAGLRLARRHHVSQHRAQPLRTKIDGDAVLAGGDRLDQKLDDAGRLRPIKRCPALIELTKRSADRLLIDVGLSWPTAMIVRAATLGARMMRRISPPTPPARWSGRRVISDGHER